jgi:hypothetical protein
MGSTIAGDDKKATAATTESLHASPAEPTLLPQATAAPPSVILRGEPPRPRAAVAPLSAAAAAASSPR